MEGRRATRWIVVLARRFQPQLAFLWDRVTPGGTFGLEFTSLMAILSVAGFVLVAYTVIVSGDPGPTPGDVTAMDVVEALRTSWLVDVAKVVTALGSSAIVLPLAAIAAAALAARRRWAELGVLVAGMAILVAGVHELKDAIDRPRPDDGLVDGLGVLLPQRPRRLLDLLRLARGDDRDAPADGDGARRAGGRGRDRRHRPGRPLPRLPRRPLHERRQRRLGARRRRLLALRRDRPRHLHRRVVRRPPRVFGRARAPEWASLLPLALQKIENEYLLFGAAGLISLVAFVALIFVPAIGSYGRIWEKAAAGFLSLIVLVALVLTGVVVGLAVVYYYNDIVEVIG